MKIAPRFLLLSAALLLVAGAKKPTVPVRFYAETNARDGSSFAQPVALLGSAKQVYVSKVPVLSERDIVGVYPVLAPDGSMGCAFKLDEHGRIALEGMSVEKRGQMLIAVVNGRHVLDMIIDDRKSDGIIYIPRGLEVIEVSLLTKKFPVMGVKKGKKAPKPEAPAKLL